jgi:hypothetical protein
MRSSSLFIIGMVCLSVCLAACAEDGIGDENIPDQIMTQIRSNFEQLKPDIRDILQPS